ncbi:high affinity copper uptake protein 1-like [Littorina saxatilis]|uniref:Copper transport protein n=1 Tax=Littorina saxatilis TaxID=31220 RepID=A0AAN9AYT1_9CAEN
MASVNHSGHNMMTTTMTMMDDNMTMGHGGHGATPMDHGTQHTMKMYFHDGEKEFILFESLHVSSVGGMVGACLAMFALAVAYEGLKYFREYLLRRITNPSKAYSPSAMNGADAIAYKQPEVGSRMLSGSHGLQTILHMVQVFVSYCLMLVFMTYNAWLCLSIVLGAGVGYFLFGWRRAMVVDLNEHCH